MTIQTSAKGCVQCHNISAQKNDRRYRTGLYTRQRCYKIISCKNKGEKSITEFNFMNLTDLIISVYLLKKKLYLLLLLY